jgi:hypothetical protein
MLYWEGYDGLSAAIATAKRAAIAKRIDTSHVLVTAPALDRFIADYRLGRFMG